MLNQISNRRSKLSKAMLTIALLLSSVVFSAIFDDTRAPASEPNQTELVLDGKKETKKHISYKKIVVALTGIQNLRKNIVQQYLLRILSENSISQIRLKQNLLDIKEFDAKIRYIQKRIQSYSKQGKPHLLYS